MGFVYKTEEFNKVLEALERKYRIFAPVLKVGEGRFRDTDVSWRNVRISPLRRS